MIKNFRDFNTLNEGKKRYKLSTSEKESLEHQISKLNDELYASLSKNTDDISKKLNDLETRLYLPNVDTYEDFLVFIEGHEELTEDDKKEFISKSVKGKWGDFWLIVKPIVSVLIKNKLAHYANTLAYEKKISRVVNASFDGDIIITDPCYFTNLGPSSDLKKYGFTSYIYEETGYGDWSADVYETRKSFDIDEIFSLGKADLSKRIGSFSADAGTVGVFLVSEVEHFIKNYPNKTDADKSNFIKKLCDSGMCTLIKDFKGKVTYKIQRFRDEFGDEAVLVGNGESNGKKLNFVAGSMVFHQKK